MVAMHARIFALFAAVCSVVTVGGTDAAQPSILERQEAMFRRTVGTPEAQRAQFPPHRIGGATNPDVGPAGDADELDAVETMFRDVLAGQERAARRARR